jgi:aspartyl protease family protein
MIRFAAADHLDAGTRLKRPRSALHCLLVFTLITGMAMNCFAEDNSESAPGDDEGAGRIVSVKVQRDSTGQYSTNGEINGKPVRLIVDTGANVVVVPEKLAKRIGLKLGSATLSRTAGGVVKSYRTTLKSMVLGPIQITDAAALVNPSMQDEFVLLGMNALGLMDFRQEGGALVLSYKAPPGSGPRPVQVESVPRFRKSLKECQGDRTVIDKATLACLNGEE